MALQGTLDTFALPDVLRLLGSTGKTGRLRVNGDRGSGSVWVVDGQVVATENVSGGSDEDGAVATVFSMLRYESGSFTFENDATTSAASAPDSVDHVLGQAELQLAEWQTIASVVPSLGCWATLSPELVGRDVVIDSSRWRVIVAIGGGATVGSVGESLELGELDACRSVKELVDLKLVEISEEAPASAAPAPEPAIEVVADEMEEPMIEAVADAVEEPMAESTEEPMIEAVAEYVEEPVSQPAPEPVSAFEIAPEAPAEAPQDDWTMESFETTEQTEQWEPSVVEEIPHADPAPWDAPPVPAVGGPVGFESLAIDGDAQASASAVSTETRAEELDPAEMARQLANLSPKAAKAVAAAAKATNAADREAALAAIEAEDSAVDPVLLMRFLGSVDG